MAWFSARRGSGGGGKVGEKGEGTEPHLWVSLVRGEEVRGGGSTGAGGQWRNCAAAVAFRRGRESEEWLGSFTATLGSCWCGRFRPRRGEGGGSTERGGRQRSGPWRQLADEAGRGWLGSGASLGREGSVPGVNRSRERAEEGAPP